MNSGLSLTKSVAKTTTLSGQTSKVRCGSEGLHCSTEKYGPGQRHPFLISSFQLKFLISAGLTGLDFSQVVLHFVSVPQVKSLYTAFSFCVQNSIMTTHNDSSSSICCHRKFMHICEPPFSRNVQCGWMWHDTLICNSLNHNISFPVPTCTRLWLWHFWLCCLSEMTLISVHQFSTLILVMKQPCISKLYSFKEIAAVLVVELNLTYNIIITYFGAIFSKDFILSLRVLLKQHQEFPTKSC